MQLQLNNVSDFHFNSFSLLKLCIFMLFLLLFSCSVVSNSLQPCGLQPTRLPCPSPTPRACSNSCPSSWWCHMFVCLALIFRYLIHLEIVFGWGVRYGSNCILLRVDTYLSQHSLFKKAIFPPLNCLGMLVKNQFTINVSVEFGTLNSIPLIFLYSYASTTLTGLW